MAWRSPTFSSPTSSGSGFGNASSGFFFELLSEFYRDKNVPSQSLTWSSPDVDLTCKLVSSKLTP